MTIAEAFGKKLRTARKEKKMSQLKAAELCKLSVKEFGNIERGQTTPSMETAIRIHTVFGVSIYGLNAELPDKE